MPHTHKSVIQSEGTRLYIDGEWIDGETPVVRAGAHALWLASTVFDGARRIRGGLPDLDRHCARVVRSAVTMGLAPDRSGPDIEALVREGVKQFPDDDDLYIKPMFWGETGFITPDPESTRFALQISVAPLHEPKGFSACRSTIRRPATDMAPTEAKAACLYPNVARALREARAKGHDTAVVLDPSGNVAEFAVANLFMVKDGVVHTPVPNGTFLNGITRQRVIQLLRDDGSEVVERTIAYGELADADELFSSANAAKVVPCIRLDERDLQPGPVYTRARELYMDFAAGAR